MIKSLAEKVVSESEGRQGEAEEKTKTSSESAPAFFDLTTLQREANGRFHLPARATLAAAQALYERYKLITYPRTDSKVLPEDYPPEVNKILNALSNTKPNGRICSKKYSRKNGCNRPINAFSITLKYPTILPLFQPA